MVLKPEGADSEEPLEEGEEALGALYPLETFVVNLKGGRYITTFVAQLEFATRDVPKRFYGRIVPMTRRGDWSASHSEKVRMIFSLKKAKKKSKKLYPR